jgi:hypothetical protein
MLFAIAFTGVFAWLTEQPFGLGFAVVLPRSVADLPQTATENTPENGLKQGGLW